MESSPLLGDTSTRSPPPPQGDIYRDAFPSSYSDSETEDEATGLPSSPPRFIDPENRRYQDTLFSTLFLGAFALLVVTGSSTLARADHANEGGMSGAIYMALRNSSGLIVGVTAASIGAGTLWILFMSAFVKPIGLGDDYCHTRCEPWAVCFILTDSVLGKREDPAYLGSQYNIMIGVAISFLMTAMGSIVYLFKRRRQIDHTIEILQLSCQILWETHHIHPLHHPHAPLHVLRPPLAPRFLPPLPRPPIYPIPMSTRTAVAFFVFMHFWTSAVLQGIEKVTISGVVGQWYFKRNELKAALTTGFGTVCFSALVLASVQTLQAFVKYVRKNSRGSNALLLLIDACLSCTSYTLDTITSMTLLYSGLTGHSLVRSGVLCTRLFRRNLVFGLTTSTLTRVVLTLGSLTAASCVGGDESVCLCGGVVGVVIPFYVLRFISHVLQHTVDATFICYMMDLDTNANNCDGAHRIFEPSLSV